MKGKRLLSLFAMCCFLLMPFYGTVAAEDADAAVTPVLLGDVDGDGAITSTDARLVLLVVTLKYEPFPGTEEAVLFDRIHKLGDVDRDTVLTSTDARLILQYVVGKITEWPNPFTIVGLSEKGQILSVDDTADGPAISGHVLYRLCVYEHGKPTKRAVTWVSADPEGITIDADGYLTHYEFGKRVLVTATLDNGETVSHLVYTHGAGLVFDSLCLAVVTHSEEGEVQYHSFPDMATLGVSPNGSDTLQFVAFDRYENIPYTGAIIWNSTKPEVASVDENGLVTIHEIGMTFITAQISDDIFLEFKLHIHVYEGIIK